MQSERVALSFVRLLLAVMVCLPMACVGGPTSSSEPERLLVRKPCRLSGEPSDPLAGPPGSLVVLVFVTQDCPIANAFVPEIRRIWSRFEPAGVRFFHVQCDGRITLEAARAHAEAYELGDRVIIDTDHVLVRRVGAEVSPEAFVLKLAADGAEPTTLYAGRIDDRFVDFGTRRKEPTTHDLADAIERALKGTGDASPRTRAIGCYLTGLSRQDDHP